MYGQILSELFERFRKLPHQEGLAPRGWNPEGGYELSDSDIARWASLLSVHEVEVFDFLACELSKDFYGGLLTWEFCDWAANGLNLTYTGYLTQLPYGAVGAVHFLDFYLAFDGSEQGNKANREALARTNVEQFLRRFN